MQTTPHSIEALRARAIAVREKVDNDQAYNSLVRAVRCEYEELYPARLAAFKGDVALMNSWYKEALYVIAEAVDKRQDAADALDELADRLSDMSRMPLIKFPVVA